MTTPLLTIGVVGAGTMGRGIVQLFAQAGHRVHCFDALPGASAKAIDHVAGMIGRGIEKGRITAEQFARIQERMHACEEVGQLRDCDVVVEAIVEDLEVKRKLFRELEAVSYTHLTLPTNREV